MLNTDLIPFVHHAVFDSRDVHDTINELTAAIEGGVVLLGTLEEHVDALAKVTAFAEEAAEYSPDWRWGTTLIADHAFEDYARELANELTGNGPNPTWPFTHIDWGAAADELKNDYTAIEFNDTTYWVR